MATGRREAGQHCLQRQAHTRRDTMTIESPETCGSAVVCSDLLARPARIVALSGGKDSTAMALGLAEQEPDEYEYCYTPTGRELPVMLDHWKRLECLLGK